MTISANYCTNINNDSCMIFIYNNNIMYLYEKKYNNFDP